MSESNMTIEMSCPVCSESVRQEIISDYRIVGKESDQRPRFLGENPLPSAICLCRSCGYAGYQPDFDLDDIGEISKVSTLLDLAEKPSNQGSGRFQRAAEIAEVRQKSHVDQAELWLQASWCAHFEERSTEEQSELRRHALAHFEAALAADELDTEDQQAAVYMIAELHRRLGNEEASREWFERLEEFETVDPSLQALRSGNLRPSQRRSAVG